MGINTCDQASWTELLFKVATKIHGEQLFAATISIALNVLRIINDPNDAHISRT
jgi:hypothetical protein